MNHDSPDLAEYVRLLISHQSGLRAFIISRMPGAPGVADVLQETNLVLWKKRESFEIDTNFRAWAFAIARNEVRTHLRKMKRDSQPGLPAQLIDELSEECGGEPDEMDRWRDALEICLAELSSSQRAVIQERYADESDEKVPASGALRARLHRIRASLRNCITLRLDRPATS